MRSRTVLRSALAPGSHSIVVMPHVECATKTVHSPSWRPRFSMAFCARSVRSTISPSPWVSSVSSSVVACTVRQSTHRAQQRRTAPTQGHGPVSETAPVDRDQDVDVVVLLHDAVHVTGDDGLVQAARDAGEVAGD